LVASAEKRQIQIPKALKNKEASTTTKAACRDYPQESLRFSASAGKNKGESMHGIHAIESWPESDCPSSCAGIDGHACTNQRVRRGKYPDVMAATRCNGLGWGLAATTTISPGTLLGEYPGEVFVGNEQFQY
jgi:hypothetical protein